ncbi:MAG: flavodoxin family protein [Planctomycetota bacterium]|jgi:multimeric flavodoxin WrbA
MNVLIVNASPRNKGITSTLLAEVETTINSTHNAEVVRIQELNIKPCTGCLKCRPDKTCILPRDDAHVLAEKIRESDLLIIGSPVYWGNMPGTLKIFFDRNVPLFEYCEAKAIKYIPKPQLKGKKAILIVSGGSPFPYNLLPSQSKGTIRSLRTVLKSGGIKIAFVLNIPDTYNFEKKKHYYLNKVKQLAISI